MRFFSLTVERFELTQVAAVARLLALWLAGLFALVVIAFLISLSAPWLVRVPPAIQAACAGLLVLSLSFLRLMFRERAQTTEAMNDFASAFEDLQILTRSAKDWGLSPEAMEVTRKRGRSLRGHAKAWWLRLEQSFEFYENGGRQGWFLTQPLQDTLSFDSVTGSVYHFNFHQAVPGILTASGLLCTFAAILLGLSGVSYNTGDLSHPITGIDSLINGLSGKFVTSIVALIMSIIFLYCEKRICERSISDGYEDMLARCRLLFPYLSQTRILLDIQMQLGRLNTPRQSLSANQV